MGWFCFFALKLAGFISSSFQPLFPSFRLKSCLFAHLFFSRSGSGNPMQSKGWQSARFVSSLVLLLALRTAIMLTPFLSFVRFCEYPQIILLQLEK
jgi:hypothetical protein